MRINLNFRPRGNFFKKFIILVLFALCCFLIKENVFAATSYNLYDYVADTTIPSLSRCSQKNDFLTKWKIDFDVATVGTSKANQCAYTYTAGLSIVDFINSAVDNGYRYIFIQEYIVKNVNGSSQYENGYYVYFFRTIPTVEVTTSTSGLNTSTKYHFINYSSYPLSFYFNTVPNTSTYNEIEFNYDYPYTYTSEYEYMSSDSEDIRYMGYSHIITNFDLYDTNGNLLESASSIGFLPPSNSSDNSNWFQKILYAITSLPNNIKSFFNNLLTGIANLFQSLFDFITSLIVPDEEMLLDTLESEYDYLHQRLGFLFYPVELITQFFTRFNNISANYNNAIINIPEVSFMGSVVVHSTTFNLLNIIDSNQILGYVYSLYRIVVSFLIVLWVSKLAYKKFNETIGGGFK